MAGEGSYAFSGDVSWAAEREPLQAARLRTGSGGYPTLISGDFAFDKHRSVDDTPAGGGAGMVMRADVAAAAIDAAVSNAPNLARIYLSPRGAPLTQERVHSLAREEGAILFCGRFEGLDQRVIEARQLEEILDRRLCAVGRRTRCDGLD